MENSYNDITGQLAELIDKEMLLENYKNQLIKIDEEIQEILSSESPERSVT